MLVHHLLENSARTSPDAPAVWFNGTWRSYAQLAADARKVAGVLREAGLKEGDRVAVLLENSFDYVAAHFGVLMAGGVDVSLNSELPAQALKELIVDSESVGLIAGRKFHKQWSPIVSSLPQLKCLLLDQEPVQPMPGLPSSTRLAYLNAVWAEPARPLAVAHRIDLDLASIVYTSGSTGRPKGVMLSHLNLVSNMRSIAAYLQLSPSDRVLVILPFYYIYGRSLLYTQFLVGGTLVIDNRFMFPASAVDTMEKMEVTGFAGVPSTFSILLNKTNIKERSLPHLRFITQAGGGMAPALQKNVVEAFPAAKVYVMYGTTEAAPRLTYVEPDVLPRKWGTIGQPVPNVEVIITDDKGDALPPNAHGEIAARGSNIMLGYWKDPAGTAEVLKNGYYHTGDLGYKDEEGYIFVTGRARDIIKAGGNRVSAKEIEDLLIALPGVLETAVIGIPDEMLGEAIKALIVPTSPALTVEAIRTHLQSLPLFKQPKTVELVPALPKNEAGKILKAVLRQQYATPTAELVAK